MLANDVSHKDRHTAPKGFVNERKVFTLSGAGEQYFNNWVHVLFVCPGLFMDVLWEVDTGLQDGSHSFW